jgi:hypothetical protein
MEEQNQGVQTPTVQKSNKGLFVLLSVFVLAIAFFGVVYFFANNDSSPETVQTASNSDSINSSADLDKAVKTIESQDLDSFENDLDANDKDVASF